MESSNIFEKLKKLQTILVNKYECEGLKEEAPKQLDAQEELLSRLKKEFIVENSDYEEVKNKVSALKLELDEAIKSRESGEKAMDSITTHREYEALEKQILEATDKENEIRKELQKEEKTLEELKESLKADEDMIKTQEDVLAAGKESLNNKLDEYNAQLAELQAEEDKITPDLDQEILFKFQRIIQRNSEGIVAVKNGVCTGCHMILPAQFANIVRETNGDDKVMFCPYCSRILFYEESDADSEESFYTLDTAGSLVGFDDDEDEEYESEEEREDLDYENENAEDSYDEDDESETDEEDEDDSEEDDE